MGKANHSFNLWGISNDAALLSRVNRDRPQYREDRKSPKQEHSDSRVPFTFIEDFAFYNYHEASWTLLCEPSKNSLKGVPLPHFISPGHPRDLHNNTCHFRHICHIWELHYIYAVQKNNCHSQVQSSWTISANHYDNSIPLTHLMQLTKNYGGFQWTKPTWT